MIWYHTYYRDGDGVPDVEDNCLTLSNPQQSDIDGDGVGDECDDDMDGDSVTNNLDNCPYVSNAGQSDTNREYSAIHLRLKWLHITSLEMDH